MRDSTSISGMLYKISNEDSQQNVRSERDYGAIKVELLTLTSFILLGM